MQVGQANDQVSPSSDRDVDRPVLVLGINYPDGHEETPHRHRRAQFLYGSSGVVLVSTPDGSWMMPPQRGLWIPAGTEHSVRMLGRVAMGSLYIDEATFPAHFHGCEVVGVSDLLRSLLMAAPSIPAEYDRGRREGNRRDCDGRGANPHNDFRFGCHRHRLHHPGRLGLGW